MPRADKLLYGGKIDQERMDRLVMLCVDDTDDVTRTTSTGTVAEAIADAVEGLGGCILLGITRHQLLLAEGVPYTSHNSSMCFAARMPEGASARLREHAKRQIAELSAASADPGLCVADMPAEWIATGVGGPATWENAPRAERIRLEALAEFGRRAQREVCSKDEAYGLAADIPWLQLSEHGGTGQGIIGALAGVGLRLAGNDGRFRGKWDLASMLNVRDAVMPAGDVCRGLTALAAGPVRACDTDGNVVAGDVPLALDAEAKPVLSRGAVTLVCKVSNGVASPARKADLDRLDDMVKPTGAGGRIGLSGGSGRDGGVARLPGDGAGGPGVEGCAPGADAGAGCGLFQPDNDAEEQRFARGSVCANCLFRRKLADGFVCMNPARARPADAARA